MSDTCVHCYGTGLVDCPACGGTGQYDDGSSDTRTCIECGGDGECCCPYCEDGTRRSIN